ncbi:MAG: DUF3379 family protein [Gammaproteobacteria bacterium]|nr:DUF3379 family protein [Gammaproteobacteria bacterium]
MNTNINCLDVRRTLGAEPQRRDAWILEHCKVCVQCAAFLKDMLALDQRVERALNIEVPKDLEARIVFRAEFRPAGRRRVYPWLAAAAAVVLAVAVGVGLWQYRQNSTAMLGQALVAHVMNPDEADALDPDRPTIRDVSFVTTVLSRAGIRMNGSMDDITYARACPFRGEMVAHLVVRGRDGPVTVLLLPHIHVGQPTHFNEQGFEGVILPDDQGSIAIIANNPTPMAPIAHEFMKMVEWSI